MTLSPTTIALAVAIPLILWRLYSRIRRLVGRQKSKLWRHWVTVIFFPSIVVLLGIVALHNTITLASLVAGVATGIGLAVWGLKRTRFESTPEGFFYTPNAHIGIAVSLLFVGRILFRLVEVYGAIGTAQPGMQDFARSPFTLVIFGILAGYYSAYAIGILRWRAGEAKSAADTQGERNAS